jgi:hypothetical protein
MNFERSNGDVSLVNNQPQTTLISIPQTRRRLLPVQFWISLTTLPLLLLGIPARAIDLHPTTASPPNFVSSLKQISVSDSENVLFPTLASARGEDDDKCVWLGVCN